jgi:hypothetical protein
VLRINKYTGFMCWEFFRSYSTQLHVWYHYYYTVPVVIPLCNDTPKWHCINPEISSVDDQGEVPLFSYPTIRGSGKWRFIYNDPHWGHCSSSSIEDPKFWVGIYNMRAILNYCSWNSSAMHMDMPRLMERKNIDLLHLKEFGLSFDAHHIQYAGQRDFRQSSQ